MPIDFPTAITGIATGAIAGWLTAYFGLRNELKVLEAKRIQADDILRNTQITHYQSLLLLAASDLQDRLWQLTQEQATSNAPVLVNQDQLKPAYKSWPMSKQHYLQSTLFLSARYFAFVEMLKHELRFLTYKQDDITRKLRLCLKKVERAFANTRLQQEATTKDDQVTEDRPIFQMQQAYVGQSLWEHKNDSIEWMSYPTFLQLYETKLRNTEDFRALVDLVTGAVSKRPGSFHRRRLCIVLNTLVELLDFLDPPDTEGNGVFLLKKERETVNLPELP
ncbi:hypothetical protein J7400_11100 [Shimia sp. R9_2]|uniref:hypothetical protein n=1 Tax=Shimia sp. R9_2 TaxID=2821112 RepID=UPI001AD9844E|nr:hypothetical protein [Shimia sp. R9_2]MBO9397228.1 hypothetical protein [Shimia sp. R9_2]